MARAFQADVIGDSADTIQRLATEHGSWLQENCQRQALAYRCGCALWSHSLGSSLGSEAM